MLRRLLLRATGFLLLLTTCAAVAVGVPLLWNAAAGKAQPGAAECRLEPLDRVTVRAEIKIVADGRTYPRMSSDLTVRIPTSNAGTEALLHSRTGEAQRAMVACLLHNAKSAAATRDSDTRIDYDNEVVEVTDRVWIDLYGPGAYWAGTTAVVVRAAHPWSLVVQTPEALGAAEWDVTISAPPGWLASPTPWQSVNAGQDKLHWAELTPVVTTDEQTQAEVVVVAANLEPDTKGTVALASNTSAGNAWSWGVNAVSALGSVVLTLYLLRRKRFAVRAVWPLAVVITVVGAGDVLSGLFQHRASVDWRFWQFAHWWFNVVAVLLLLVLAVAWWLPRAFIALVGLGLVGAMVLLWQARGYTALGQPGTGYTDALDLGIAFLVMFTFLVAAGKAFQMTLGRGRPRDLPVWLMLTSAAVAAVLVVERYAIAHWNAREQEWLGGRAALQLTEIYRRFAWDVFDGARWLPLALTAAALWYFARREKFPPTDDRALVTAVVLFAVGPWWWEILVAGWAVPVWPLTLGLLALFVTALRTWKLSVLRKAGAGPELDIADLRTKASADPSAVDVLLAAGPAGNPVGNMRTAVRLGLVVSIVVGVGMATMYLVLYPPLAPNQQDSVLLRVAIDLLWQAIVWLSAIAATGLAWQHLPGRRGVLKVLPIIALYAVGPCLQAGINVLTGVRGWDSLVSLAVFAVVLVILGLRMDKASLDAVALPADGGLRRFFRAYGLEGFSAKLTAALTPLIAVLTIWSALNGGDVSPPTTEPPRPNPAVQPTGRG